MIGIGVPAVIEERVMETIAAETGRTRLTLRHAIKYAARHMPSDIPAAKLAGVRLGSDRHE